MNGWYLISLVISLVALYFAIDTLRKIKKPSLGEDLTHDPKHEENEEPERRLRYARKKKTSLKEGRP